MVDLNRLGFVGPVSADEPLIVHAPTRRGAKGTDVLMDAVERLRAEGYRFRFELFEDLAHAELIERLRAADIVVDQLLIGWYGVLSVEAMALGKVPVAYLRPDLRHHVPEEVLAEASPDTIYRVLRDLVRDPGLRARIGHAARGYAERVHGPEAVMQRLDAVYAEVRAAHEDRPAVPPDTSALAGRVRAAARGRIPQRLLGLGVQRHPHQLRRPLPIRATNWLAKRLRGKR
jgi:glycosyltransferase involved in cell wall biosynthesis